jgi:hypothetical protein
LKYTLAQVLFRTDVEAQPFAFGGEEGPEKFNPDIRYRGSLQNYLIEFPFYDDPKQQIESDYGLGSPVSALHREARLREFPHRDDVEGKIDLVFEPRRALVCRDFFDKSGKK